MSEPRCKCGKGCRYPWNCDRPPAPTTETASYATCECGCQRFHETSEISVRGNEAVFFRSFRCDGCGRKLARAEAGT